MFTRIAFCNFLLLYLIFMEKILISTVDNQLEVFPSLCRQSTLLMLLSWSCRFNPVDNSRLFEYFPHGNVVCVVGLATKLRCYGLTFNLSAFLSLSDLRRLTSIEE